MAHGDGEGAGGRIGVEAVALWVGDAAFDHRGYRPHLARAGDRHRTGIAVDLRHAVDRHADVELLPTLDRDPAEIYNAMLFDATTVEVEKRQVRGSGPAYGVPPVSRTPPARVATNVRPGGSQRCGVKTTLAPLGESDTVPSNDTPVDCPEASASSRRSVPLVTLPRSSCLEKLTETMLPTG